jgi:hypothetical protein
MNVRVFFWSLTSVLAGFLFGFDTVVISGAEKTIQSLLGAQSWSPRHCHGFHPHGSFTHWIFAALLSSGHDPHALQ